MALLPNICEYEGEYHDAKTGKHAEYRCERTKITVSNFCEFHDKNYVQTNKNEVKQSFLRELRQPGGSQNTPLFFVGCNIPTIEISGIIQNRPVYFTNSKFHGNVEFVDNEFKTVDFTGVKFSGTVKMTSVNIGDIFLFKKVKWNENNNRNVEFRQCAFGTSNFWLTTVDNISFYNCEINFGQFRTFEFTENMNIRDCTFKDKTDFSNVKFNGDAVFTTTSFRSNVSFQFTKFPNSVKFYIVDFKKQQLVFFEGDLSNISFANTDITRIKFGGNTTWGGADRYTICDEIELVKNPEKYNISSVLSIYRNLRENYEFHLMYEEAGQFFVKEMELKRVYFQDPEDSNKTKIKKYQRYISITNCYNILSKYGESFKQVSAWSVGLFASAFTYFFICPDVNLLDKTEPLGDIDYAAKLSEDVVFRGKISLERTLGAFFQMNEGGVADYLVRIASLPILGTMFIVLRRRFERRFRH